jgi:hypothetical protein
MEYKVQVSESYLQHSMRGKEKLINTSLYLVINLAYALNYHKVENGSTKNIKKVVILFITFH